MFPQRGQFVDVVAQLANGVEDAVKAPGTAGVPPLIAGLAIVRPYALPARFRASRTEAAMLATVSTQTPFAGFWR